MGGTGCSSATPAAEGPHWGMGGARMDGRHPVTGPILKNINFHGKKDAYVFWIAVDIIWLHPYSIALI